MIDIKKYEKLSALNLSEEEEKNLAKDLEEIIQYFEILKEVDTNNVEPYIYTQGAKLFLREDKIGENTDKESLKKNRELFNGKFYRIKKIMGE